MYIYVDVSIYLSTVDKKVCVLITAAQDSARLLARRARRPLYARDFQAHGQQEAGLGGRLRGLGAWLESLVKKGAWLEGFTGLVHCSPCSKKGGFH